MTTVFPLRTNVTTNSSVRQFFAASSKTANSKAVSVTRADVMLCELIRDRGTKYSPDDTLTKAMKLNLKYSNVSR